MDNIQIITTSDGSHSLLNTNLNETYHSHHGALQESIHVFINNGLKFFIDKSSPKTINIFEVGFGTGLNALLTLQYALKSDLNFSYTSIEAFPLDKEIWSQLNYGNVIGLQKYYDALHDAHWGKSEDVLPNFSLLKLETTLQQVELEVNATDLIFFDAFAPSKQPEMWSIDLLSKVVSHMRSGGMFVTYSAKGQLKRDLKMLGLQVETLAGPPGKMQMIRALKI